MGSYIKVLLSFHCNELDLDLLRLIQSESLEEKGWTPEVYTVGVSDVYIKWDKWGPYRNTQNVVPRF